MKGSVNVALHFDDLAEQFRVLVRQELENSEVVLLDFQTWRNSPTSPRTTKRIESALQKALARFTKTLCLL